MTDLVEFLLLAAAVILAPFALLGVALVWVCYDRSLRLFFVDEGWRWPWSYERRRAHLIERGRDRSLPRDWPGWYGKDRP